MKGFAARDLDSALAVYVRMISVRLDAVGGAWRAAMKTSSRCFRTITAEMSDSDYQEAWLGHNIQRFAGTGKDGKPLDLTFRVSGQEDQRQMDDRRGAPLVPRCPTEREI